MLAFAAVLLSPVVAGADEQRAAPAHIAAVRAFLVAWGHERWTISATSPPTPSP